MNTINPLQIIRDYLIQSGSDLYTSIGTNIFTNMPKDNTSPFIVMSRRGGSTFTRVPIRNPWVQFKVFSGTGSIVTNPSGALTCITIAEQLHSKLDNTYNEVGTNGTIVRSLEQQAPQDLVDPDTRWPYVLVYYDIITSSKV